MKNRILFLLATLSTIASIANAQVQVRDEPHHKNILENKYARVLDVSIKPHDTTFFHIHSTPSVILLFTSTVTASQIRGQGWVRSASTAGTAFYRPFEKDTLVHRVSNGDTVPYHVNDIELLSAYISNSLLRPLPFTVLFENEKVFAYRLTGSSFNKQVISNRGPILAGLVAGDGIVFHDTKNNKEVNIVAGKTMYIEPGSSFYLSATKQGPVNLVLFEIK